ncbi:hypothetical protein TNCV_540571 [Trichonephila clavipes]|nr:hypothetical protein TNCV_540571 [Trichonephila clavipes]
MTAEEDQRSVKLLQQNPIITAEKMEFIHSTVLRHLDSAVRKFRKLESRGPQNDSSWTPVVQRHAKSVEAQIGVVGKVGKVRYKLRCRLRHLTMVQNDVVKSSRVALQCDVNIHSLNGDNGRK